MRACNRGTWETYTLDLQGSHKHTAPFMPIAPIICHAALIASKLSWACLQKVNLYVSQAGKTVGLRNGREDQWTRKRPWESNSPGDADLDRAIAESLGNHSGTIPTTRACRPMLCPSMSMRICTILATCTICVKADLSLSHLRLILQTTLS